MRLIKIVIMMKRKFAEFYEVKHYRKQPSEQVIVKQYELNKEVVFAQKNDK